MSRCPDYSVSLSGTALSLATSRHYHSTIATHLNPSHVRRLLPERLTTHVEAVLADEARFLLLAVDDAVKR